MSLVGLRLFSLHHHHHHQSSFIVNVYLNCLLFLSFTLINCSPVLPTSSDQIDNRNSDLSSSPIKELPSSWSLALPLLPFSSSSSSSSSSLSFPWTSYDALGSEDVKNIVTSEPLSSSSSSSQPVLVKNTNSNSIISPGNETVNLYSDLLVPISSVTGGVGVGSVGRPLTPTFRTNVYRCDKTLAIIDYIDENRIFRCELFDLDKRLTEAQESVTKRQASIVDVSFSALSNLISRCQDLERFTITNGPSLPINLQSDEPLDNNRNNNTAAETIYGFWRGVIPGTKWCGPGDIAKDYFDIGQIWEIDLCCRAHDHCPYRLKAFRHGYGLINLAFYTRSHCECDDQFHRCLKKSNNNLASTLGNIYFNVIQVQCFKEEEETNCIRSRLNSNGQKVCTSYAPNGNRKMVFAAPKPYN